MSQNKSRNLLKYLRKLKEATSELRGISIQKEGYSQVLSGEEYERPEIEDIVFDDGGAEDLIKMPEIADIVYEGEVAADLTKPTDKFADKQKIINAVQRHGAPGRKDLGFPSPSGKKKH